MAKDFFSPEAHLNDLGISLYVDGLLLEKTGELPAEILDHVEDCSACKKEIISLFDIMKAQSASVESPHPFFDQSEKNSEITSITESSQKEMNGWQVFTRIAAVIVIAFGLNYVIQVVPGQNQISVAELQKLYPEQTAISPDLESARKDDYRSYSINISVDSFQEDQVYSGEVTFSWNAVGDIPALSLRVLDNQEEDILKGPVQVRGNSHTISELSQPGLYYWKLETETDIVYVGRFYYDIPELREN